jgi:anaerobic magnesium-protoporphyrin IX monomethyl ester cyclase
MGEHRQLSIVSGRAPALPRATPVHRDVTRPIALIGFLQQGNLGLGYLAATLRAHGYGVQVLDFEADPHEIWQAIDRSRPFVVGFSLIFQFYLPRFAALIGSLRERGVDAHFTMGGHFPTLSTRQTLEAIPQLDSVVRYEGELTLLELADRLGAGQDFRDVHGIAYLADGELVQSPTRALVEDLDGLPWPERNFEPESILGQRAMPLLASRGCARTCSFCSIHTFYRSAPGKVVRTRKPSEVVREMCSLYVERGITIFLFQDDDFPLFGPVWKRWTREFLRELHAAGLPGKVIWKINCRADAVDEELFAEMKGAGLFLVYMGLESGTDEGLDTLNKRITVEQNLRAVALLKRLGLMYEFGFMMFDPSSTFASVRENVHFLEAITGDGSAAAVFCRMLPYDGTPIKVTLQNAGRLRGDVCNPDYAFLDPRLEAFYDTLNRLMNITGWIHGYRALSPQLNWAWTELAVLQRLYPPLMDVAEYEQQLAAITRASNRILLGTVETLSYVFCEGSASLPNLSELSECSAHFLEQLVAVRDTFFARHQSTLQRSLNQRNELGPMPNAQAASVI